MATRVNTINSVENAKTLTPSLGHSPRPLLMPLMIDKVAKM